MSKRPTPERGMTQAEAELVVDLQNVEMALHRCGDRASVLLAGALAVYRRRLERKGGFVRLQPDPALDWLLDIACVLTGSGREPDDETEDRPRSIQDVYLHNADARKTTNETYQSLWRKFRPAD